MQFVGRFGTLIGFACQVIAAGAAIIWPEYKWIGWSLFVLGGLVLAVTFGWWLRLNKEHVRQRVRRVEPIHVIASGLVIAIGGVIWMIYRGPKVVDVETPTLPPSVTLQPAPPPQIATAPYDVPKKLALIDAFLDILRRDIASQLISARKVQQDWKSRIQTTEDRIAFMGDVAAFRHRCEDVRIKINKLQYDNQHFEDIFILLEQSYVGAFFRGIDQLRGAIGSLGDPPYKMDLDFFVKSYSDEFLKGIDELSNWYDRRNAQAVEMRKRLSR